MAEDQDKNNDIDIEKFINDVLDEVFKTLPKEEEDDESEEE